MVTTDDFILHRRCKRQAVRTDVNTGDVQHVGYEENKESGD